MNCSGLQLSSALLVLALVAPAPTAAEVPVHVRLEKAGVSAERLQRLSAVLHDYVGQQKLPGVVVHVSRRGEVVYHEAIGQRDRESGAPMTKDVIFRIASQTKAIISVGVMILQEEGRLLISDPVGKYLPEFQQTTVAVARDDGGYDVVPARRPVTIRDLLTHTAGIGYGNGPAGEQWKQAGLQGWYFAERDEPVRLAISRLATLPFDAQPGERWVYGYNTDILGALIESVSGQELDEFLRDHILEPLDMRDTHFYLPETKRDRLAVVYSTSDHRGLERAPNPGGMIGQGAYVDGPRRCFSGGAGLLSTARDYARFLQMMLNGGELYGQRILTAKTVQLMTVNHLQDLEFQPGVGFGLGVYVVQDLGARGQPGSLGEYGWGGAYHSTYWVDPEQQLVVAYFTQVIPANNLDDHGKLRALVYQALVD